MRVAILSSEVVPFAKTGGLADVAGALPKRSAKHDVDAALILPLYESDRSQPAQRRSHRRRRQCNGAADSADARLPKRCRGRAGLSDRGARLFFAQVDLRLLKRSRALRFFLARGLALLKHLDWQPDIVHGNDWPCGFAMAELRARRRHDEFFRDTQDALLDSQPRLPGRV